MHPAQAITLCTVRIVCTRGNAVSFGTGFFYKIPISEAPEETGAFFLVITNKHVIRGFDRAEFVVNVMPQTHTRDATGVVREREVQKCTLENLTLHVIDHPDPNIDLCAIPFAWVLERIAERQQMLDCLFLDATWMPSGKEEELLRPIEPIMMIGYPNGLWDEFHNRPVARRGTTATHPLLKWNNRADFMIDAACFPGSSGSPVFLFEDGMFRSDQNAYSPGTRVRLLGVLWGGPQASIEGKIEVREIPHNLTAIPVSQVPMNLGFVVHARELKVIESQVKQRHATSAIVSPIEAASPALPVTEVSNTAAS